MSVRALISKHSFAPAEARGDSDNAFDTQKDAIAYADAEITIRVTSSYYGFLYVEPGGQCDGNRPCQFHVFTNGANKVELNTKKKWTPWQKELIKELIKEAGKTVPFQTKPVTSRTPEGSDSEEEDCDSDEIERLKQELAEQKEKYRNAKEKFMKKLKQELDEQKERIERKIREKVE